MSSPCRSVRRNPRTARERGVALLLVVTILVAMVLVALPFAVSMRQGEERTQAIGAQQRAEHESRMLADLVKLHLQRSLPVEEQARQDAGLRSVEADPTVDSLEELTPDDRFRARVADQVLQGWLGDRELASRATWLKSRGLDPITDDRGSIWSVEVQDAQARVHVEGASPFLLGNLFGGALLAEDVDAGSGDLAVEHVSAGYGGMPGGFDPKGGYVRVGGEVIRYASFDGRALRGCERGALRDVPLKDNGAAAEHEQGTPVVDYVAYKLATHVIARNPGRLTPFRTLEELRDIASWGPAGVLTAARLERLLPFLTVWSRRETSSGWLAEQLVTNALPASAEAGGPEVARVRDRENPTGTTRYFGPGVILRVSDGIRSAYQTVANLGDETGRQVENQVTLAGPVNAADEEMAFEGGRTTLAAWAPRPININTASREVLFAVMANVHLRGAKTPDKIITPELALRLADMIVTERKGDLRTDADSGLRSGGPFRNAGDVGRWLGSLVDRNLITRDQRAALYLNAINPHSSSLALGTAPWSFRSLDVYHVESRVTVNDRSGQQVAEAGLREVVQIGPGAPSTWSVDSQSEFEERLSMGSGAKWATSYPYGVVWRDPATSFVQPGLRGPKGWVNDVYPDAHRGENLGDVRLEPFRMQLPGAQLVEHFDDAYYTEGWYTGMQGAWTTKTTGTMRRTADARVQPFSMSFWWRPYTRANWTAFDVGMERFQNRFALFVTDGAAGQELVFRVCSSVMEQQGAEVYVPLDRLSYEPGDWYHIEVACRGEDPSSMRLLVDGIDLGIRRGFTYLTSDLATDDTELNVELLEQFPERGAVRIGTEIIEYEEAAGQALRECRRGARGTLAASFPAGTPVELLGYSLPLTVDLLRGGATLSSELRKFSAVRVVGFEDTLSVTLENSDTPVTIGGYGPENTSPQLQAIPMWGQTDEVALGAFQDEGLALLGCVVPGNVAGAAGGAGPAGPADEFGDPSEPSAAPPVENPGGAVDPDRTPTDGGTGTAPTPPPAPPTGTPAPTDNTASGSGSELGGWEVVHYRRNGNTFNVTRYQKSAWQGEADPYFLVTRQITANLDWPAYLVPISVHAAAGENSGSDDYLDPAKADDRVILGRYYEGEEFTAYVLLGTDNPDGEHEVIAYNSIDRERASSGAYFVRDRQLGALTSHFFGQSYTLGGGTSTDGGGDPPPAPDPTPDPVDPGPLPPGGIPNGQRTPTDGGGATDGGSSDGGSSGGGSSPAPEPGADDGSADVTPDDDTGGFTDADEGGSTGGGASAGGMVDPGQRDGGGGGGGTVTPPDPDEPEVDDSGGGDSEAEGDGTENPVPPGDVAPGQREPTDPPADSPSDPGELPFPDPEGPETARVRAQFRGVLDTRDQDHSGATGDRNDRFLPCFRVFEGVQAQPTLRAGAFDRITINDGLPEGANLFEASIRWGHEKSGWCALEDFTDLRVNANQEGAATRRTDTRGFARIQKFPCGELPERLPDEIEFARSTISNSDVARAFLDEVHFWRHLQQEKLSVVNADGLSADADRIELGQTVSLELVIGDIEGANKDCGAIILDGEIIIYRELVVESDRVVLERCARGQMGSRATPHAFGSAASFLPDVMVSYLDGGLQPDAASIPLARTEGWPREGLVRIVSENQGEGELVHFTRRTDEALLMPESLDPDPRDRGRGLFRGRFGTAATSHENDAVVIFQPFRYWDRFTPRGTRDQGFEGVYAHPESSYLELGVALQDAWWHGFTWDENVVGTDVSGGTESSGSVDRTAGYLDVVVMARFNPSVPWDSEQVVDMRSLGGFGSDKVDLGDRARDSLFVFNDPGDLEFAGGNKGNVLGLEAEAAEFRIYFEYKPNSWESNDFRARGVPSIDDERRLPLWWKRTPWFQALRASVSYRTRTLYSAPIR